MSHGAKESSTPPPKSPCSVFMYRFQLRRSEVVRAIVLEGSLHFRRGLMSSCAASSCILTTVRGD